ncbi:MULTISPECIES: FAD-binding oxidoreductase [Asticcacaulis]|uniref:NAD(P)/FAD-dependent oxidoreductase n=1 Tax=Asticcacaulis TaxID=76890 RepID=UPI001AE6D3C4|nr:MULTISPECIES: FAD-binding oxidoreductase [Asticcacaulis]MBP2160986.1 D-amino-acid dehydrogenase [Asticcacaulis solisilvae]MDR6802031.1 D-amino-acid dehydrogenase [Asticcacaulis sp. BE141]
MDVIVVGGGVVGLNIALSLQAQGQTITLIERERNRTSASYGNAGHIAIEQVEPLASMAMIRSAPGRLYPKGALALPLSAIAHWLPFSLRLLHAAKASRFAAGKAALSAVVAQAMPAWHRRMANIGATDLLRTDGHYIVWESAESARKGRAAWTAADTGTAIFHDATEAELRELSSITSTPVHGAIRFENTGQIIDNRRLLEALEAAFVARGGVIITADVANITDGNAPQVRLSSGDVVPARKVVVAAGVWSKALLEPLGVTIPIIAERGYHIQSPVHKWPKGLPPVVFEDRSMIVTGFEGGLRAASFVELGHVSGPPDRSKWTRLRRHVSELGLPFTNLSSADEWYGARPTLPDYLPAIGRLTPEGNVWYAFGHQHLGLTLAAITGEMAADMLSGTPAPTAFSLKRFQ